MSLDRAQLSPLLALGAGLQGYTAPLAPEAELGSAGTGALRIFVGLCPAVPAASYRQRSTATFLVNGRWQ